MGSKWGPGQGCSGAIVTTSGSLPSDTLLQDLLDAVDCKTRYFMYS